MKYQSDFTPIVIVFLTILSLGVLILGYVVYKDKTQLSRIEKGIQDLQNSPISDTTKNVAGNNATITTEDVDKNPSLPPQEGLPVLVEAKRQAIYKATVARDINKLKAEVDASATDTLFDFNKEGKSPHGQISGYTKYWEEQKNVSIFDLIPRLLRLPYNVSDPLNIQNNYRNRWTTENKATINSNNLVYYTWPYMVVKSDWSALDIANMKMFLTDGEIELMEGGWSYFNIVITSDGRWIYPSGQGD